MEKNSFELNQNFGLKLLSNSMKLYKIGVKLFIIYHDNFG